MHQFLPVRLRSAQVVRLLIQGAWFVTCLFPCLVFRCFVVLPRVAFQSSVVVLVTAFGIVRFGSAVVLLPLQCLLPSQLLRWLPVRFPLRVPGWWVLPCVWLLQQPFRPRRLDQRVGLDCV